MEEKIILPDGREFANRKELILSLTDEQLDLFIKLAEEMLKNRK